MEQYGNELFNVERVLRENIHNNEYMRKEARALETWEAVVDEIYRTVDHVEPWMSGNIQQRGPSSAFCLLYRFFELKLTEEQIQDTITCKDGDYIRAVGFLYLRYVCPPPDLQAWLEPHFHDQTLFWPSGEGNGKQVTIGAFVTDLVLSQNYFETIFTRIPKKIADEVTAYLKGEELPHVALGNGGQGGQDRRGGDDGRARPASVKASLSVAMNQRAPNRAGTIDTKSAERPQRHDGPAKHDHPTQGQGRPPSDWRDADHARDGGFARGPGARDPLARDPAEHRRDDPRGPDRRQERYPDYRERDRGQDQCGRGRGGGGAAAAYGGREGFRRDPRNAGPSGRDWRDRGPRDRDPHSSSVFGRSAADVFSKPAAAAAPKRQLDDELDDDLGAPKAVAKGITFGRRR